MGNRGCRGTGINIVPWQIERAKLLAKRRGLEQLVDFKLVDFTNTKLPAASFTVVWGLESIVHAKDKQAFIREAYRLLKPGGRLLVAEYLLVKDALQSEDQNLLDRWLKGWAMPSLLTEAQYKQLTQKTGFVGITIHDWTKQVAPSLTRLNRFVRIFRPVAPLLHTLGLVNEGQLGNLAACEAQMELLAKGQWRYKVIVAKKP